MFDTKLGRFAVATAIANAGLTITLFVVVAEKIGLW